MPKETMPKETMPKETMPKDTMPKDNMMRAPCRTDSILKDTLPNTRQVEWIWLHHREKVNSMPKDMMSKVLKLTPVSEKQINNFVRKQTTLYN